jgi:hypothetical protein
VLLVHSTLYERARAALWWLTPPKDKTSMWKELLNELLADVREAAGESDHGVQAAADDAVDYAEARARHLAALLAAEEPGFAEAVRVERDNVALKAGIILADEADEQYARLVGMVEGSLLAVARVIAALR